MTNKALLEEITKNVSNLDSHLKRLKNKPDQLHEIDIDLLSEKLRGMYSLILELDAGHQVQEEKNPEKKEEELPATSHRQPEPESNKSSESGVRSSELPETIDEQAVAEPEPEIESSPIPVNNPVPRPSFPEPESIQPTASNPQPSEPESNKSSESGVRSSELPETIDEQAVAEPEPEIESSPIPVNNPVPRPSSPEPEPIKPIAPSLQQTEPEPKTTADLFSGATTIADSFQAEKDNSIAATVNPHTVQDLKMAIGINDKFLFINELFEGDPSVYNQAIESINATAGPDEAVHAMDGYRQQYSWADNSEAYHRLKKIVKSKYNS